LKEPLIILAGPTASGKTQVACELAKLLPLEAISCDSMQVYKGMSILTQAPDRVVQKKLKTHLVSFLEPSKPYSAALFRENSEALIQKIHANKKIPVLVGGTGLYVRALLDGLFETAAASDMKLREKLLKAQEKHGNNYLHERLKKVDAPAAAKIHPNDWRRLIRALEVHALTKKPFSKQKLDRKGIREDYDCRFYFLDRERADLYARVDARVDVMMKKGLAAEVKKLIKKRLSLTASQALGIKEMKAYLSGEVTKEKAVELLKTNTRHYAKRQVSWFRHEKGVEIVPVAANATAAQIAKDIYERTRGTSQR
jgi:tRNA dimethylallyltransferase